MTSTRGLALLLQPENREPLHSYVDRLAARHDVPLSVMLSSLGLIDEHSRNGLRGYGVYLSETRLRAFCNATHLLPERASAMLLSSYDGIAISLPESSSHSLMLYRSSKVWAYVSGSHVCPHCIRESGGVWQLPWKLPASFACTRHSCYLIETCPACERRIGRQTDGHKSAPSFLRFIPTPGFCMNSQARGKVGRGLASIPCGHSLGSISTIPAEEFTLAYQSRVDQILFGNAHESNDSPFDPLSFFQELRSLCSLILYCAEPDDLGDRPQAGLAAFEAIAKSRNRRLEEFSHQTPPRTLGQKSISTTEILTNTQLMATLIGASIDIMDADNSEHLKGFLLPLAQRCSARSTKNRWQIASYFRLTGRVAKAFHECLAQQPRTFNRCIGNRSVHREQSHIKFGPQHVPQLIWRKTFKDGFEKFFPGVPTGQARCFCSLSLVRICTESTWDEALAILEVPWNSVNFKARKIALQNNNEFVAKLNEVVLRLNSMTSKIDYSQRRRDFALLTCIPELDWNRICQRAEICPRVNDNDNRNATAWLWAELTGGNWRWAPGLKGVTKNSMYGCKLFQARFLPQLEAGLRRYGENLTRYS